MKQLEAMQILARVAELVSYTRAAASLGMPKARAELKKPHPLPPEGGMTALLFCDQPSKIWERR